MEYHGHKYYPESMYKELIQNKTTQEENIYSLQGELKEKKKEVDELRSRY
jgi:predicted RNase H-like nuclease (RuvC/YqgF family)